MGYTASDVVSDLTSESDFMSGMSSETGSITNVGSLETGSGSLESPNGLAREDQVRSVDRVRRSEVPAPHHPHHLTTSLPHHTLLQSVPQASSNVVAGIGELPWPKRPSEVKHVASGASPLSLAFRREEEDESEGGKGSTAEAERKGGGKERAAEEDEGPSGGPRARLEVEWG